VTTGYPRPPVRELRQDYAVRRANPARRDFAGLRRRLNPDAGAIPTVTVPDEVRRLLGARLNDPPEAVV